MVFLANSDGNFTGHNLRAVRSDLFVMEANAYFDLGEMNTALSCAHAAEEENPKNISACNLLGAIYFHLTQTDRGHNYFMKSISHGSSRSHVYREMRSVLKMLDVEQQRTTAIFLLNQDPENYAWVADILPNSSGE